MVNIIKCSLIVSRCIPQAEAHTFTKQRRVYSFIHSLILRAKMSGEATANNPEDTFQGTLDRYNGVTVHSSKEPCSAETFLHKLKVSLRVWEENKLRGVWFKICLEHADWVPILARNKFWFHHARQEIVTMCRWLPESELCNIPTYSHTMIGVGGLVTDSQGRVLVVKERFWTFPNWKLPGGYLERGEDISDAAVREVLEETGVSTKFNSLVGFRHSHGSQFDCSDIYLVAHLSPEDENQPLKKCQREIAECCWMRIEEYLEHPEVHSLNRLVMRKFMENSSQGVSMPSLQLPHPLFKNKQITMYTLDSSTQS